MFDPIDPRYRAMYVMVPYLSEKPIEIKPKLKKEPIYRIPSEQEVRPYLGNLVDTYH